MKLSQLKTVIKEQLKHLHKEGVKVIPRDDSGPCCCHTFFDPDCGWDCMPGATWHSKCCKGGGHMSPPITKGMEGQCNKPVGEGVKVIPKGGKSCCCEEQFNPWTGKWDCLGSSSPKCCK